MKSLTLTAALLPRPRWPRPASPSRATRSRSPAPRPSCPTPRSSPRPSARTSDFKTPVVDSGGSCAGMQQFCKGVGDDTIDIANSSRPIKESEVKSCADNGVTEIVEVRIGYDGIVFATDIGGPAFDAFTPATVVPGPRRRRWSWTASSSPTRHQVGQVNPSLPDWADPRLHPGRQARHPRGLRGEGDPAGLRGRRRHGGDPRHHGGDEDAATTPASSSARTAPRSTSTATTPRRSPASTATRTASASSASPSTRTTPTS